MKPLPRYMLGESYELPAADPLCGLLARHIMLPGHEIAAHKVRRHETIAQFIERAGWNFSLPTICVVDGAPVLRGDWSRRKIKPSDHVAFISKPWGKASGTGKQVLGLIALIGLAAIAPGIGGWLATSIGLPATILGVSSGALLGAGLTLGGALLINSLVAPKPAAVDTSAASADAIYSVSASGNTGKPLAPIPVVYGKIKTFADYAATPWSEFVGNDQYLNVPLVVGCGKYIIHQLFIDDTVIWDESTGINSDFAGISVGFYDPGDQIALFPIDVSQSVEVSGQELPDPHLAPTPGWVGGFIANASGSSAMALALDFVFPGGCFNLDSHGNISAREVGIYAEARPVDGAGGALGAFASLIDETVTFATRNPQRLSYKVDVTPGRYEVRVHRTNTPLSGTEGSDAIAWAGLRSFLDGPATFPGVSVVAIRIQANAQLTSNSAKKFGILRTRILPVWSGSAWVDTATQNPYWAFYDAATNTDYGAKRPISKIDFQNIVDGAAAAAARGDTFNYVFGAVSTIPQAFDTILKSARARHRWSGDVLTSVRDEWRAVPDMLITDREIARGSISVDWLFNTDDSADAVVFQYLDENTWLPAEVQYPPNGDSFTAQQPARIQLDGVTNRAHAYRECAFQWLQSQLRRTNITLDTEHDGRRLAFGAAVRVQSELPQSWGATGIVVSHSGDDLTLDPAPDWTEAGQHYIGIRDKRGRLFGPVKCSQGSSAAIAALDPTDRAAVEAAQSTTLANALARADAAEDPSFAFGVGSTWSKPCVVLSGRPNGDRVTVALFVDDPAVHATDIGTVISPPTVPVLVDSKAPQVAGLNASFRQGVAEPIIDVSWWPAPGAIYYLAEVSYDAGGSWLPIYEGAATSFSKTVDLAALRLRVAAVGARRGAWLSVDVDPPTISIARAYLASDVQATLDLVQPALDAAMQAVTALNTDLPNPTSLLTGLVSHSPKDKIEAMATALIAVVLRTALIESSLRGAGIDINPDLGTVKIWAVDQLRDGLTSYQSTVSGTFDAVNAQIALRATVTQLSDTASAILAGFSPAYRYEFNGTSEGWTSSNETITNNVGSITAAGSGAAPYLQSPTLALDADANKLLQIKVRRTAGAGYLVLKWGASYTHSVTLDLPADPTAWNSLAISIADANWTGTITSVRLYLGTTTGDTFEIDFIAFGASQFQQLVLAGLDARVSTVEVDLDALNSEIALKADLAVVNAQAATLSSVSADLSAADAAIALKASQAALDALAVTVTDVSLTLDAVAGTITGSIDTMRDNQQEKDLAAATIAALLNGQTIKDNLDTQAAFVRQTLSAKIDSETAARATADLEIGVVIGNTAAAVSVEQQARVDGDSALADELTLLQAAHDGNTAAISDEQSARVDGDSALADKITTLQGNVGDNHAAIIDESLTRADGDSANAHSIDSLSTTVGGHTAQLGSLLSSVNGSQVQAGWVATIDGVTGGVLFSGFKVGGVTTYTFQIAADTQIKGKLTAAQLDVSELTAISANFGTATVDGRLTSQNGKMIIDFANNRMLFTD